MESFPVSDHRREQQKISALLQFRTQLPPDLIAGLRLHGKLAIRTILRAEPREEQAQEMINLRHRRHGAFPTAARRALFDADGWRKAAD